MSRAVVAVPSGMDAESPWKQMRHLVVVDDGRIAGVITDRDLGGVHGDGVRSGKRIIDLMAPSVLVVDSKTLVGILTTSGISELVGSNRR